MRTRFVIAFLLMLMLTLPVSAVVLSADDRLSNPSQSLFNDYWYPNGAEISRFDLKQARYGKIHRGDAVLIFVTESMNPDIQVKADNPDPSNIPVLKLNATRKFYTGIYPYSVMTSVFTPVDASLGLPLKLSTSVQEWCGHVYIQLNLEADRYMLESHSYFEQEGDQRYELGDLIPEDGLWNRIRIAPADLPVGMFKIIPGAVYARFLHRKISPVEVTASLGSTNEKSLEDRALTRYELVYEDGRRRLVIMFEKEFPHRIQRWEEHEAAAENETLITQAERTHTIMIDYWNRHDPSDRKLLKRLGLGDRQ